MNKWPYDRVGISWQEHLVVQWNLSNPTCLGTREMCRIVQDVGILSYILVNRNTL